MDKLLDKLVQWGCDVPSALERFIDDKELYVDCLKAFEEDENFGLLEENLAKQDYKAAFDNAHTLKGVSANLSLTPLLQKLSDVVEDLRGDLKDTIDIHMTDMREEYKNYKRIMAEA